MKGIGGALCMRLDSVPASTMFNRATGAGLGEPLSEAELDAIVTFLDGTRFYLSIAPDARPPELPEWLEARGLVPGYAWTKFARPAADPPEARTELRVERVETGETFAGVAARGFGMPDIFADWLEPLPGREGWHCFVAFDGAEPAGAGALFVTGKTGWLGIAATLPEHRGKGAQSAIIAKRIEAAAALGCEVVVTETGEPVDGQPGPSYRNLLRAGLEPLYVRPNYERAAIAAS